MSTHQISMFPETSVTEPDVNRGTPENFPPASPWVSPWAYAHILVDTQMGSLDRPSFTYAVPEELQRVMAIGQPVLVPFGRQPMVRGFVLGPAEPPNSPSGKAITLKSVLEILDETPLFGPHYLGQLQRVADYYGCSLSQVIQAALPASLLAQIKKEIHLLDASPQALALLPSGQRLMAAKIQQYLARRNQPVSPQYLSQQIGVPLKQLQPVLRAMYSSGILRSGVRRREQRAVKLQWAIQLNSEIAADAVSENHIEKLAGKFSDKQQPVLDYLMAQAGSSPSQWFWETELRRRLGVSSSVFQTLAKIGVIQRVQKPFHSDILGDVSVAPELPPLVLNSEQERVLQRILEKQHQHAGGQAFLLNGITGSGKTEVYIRLIEETLAKGKSVLFLVPEIALTAHLTQRLLQRLQGTPYAVWHSHLSDGERSEAWRQIAAGDIRLVIGARSAIFTPLTDCGLIIMDEAHDGSFKQESPAPRYHAKTLAFQWAKESGATVVLGSATPDVVDYYFSHQGQTENQLPFECLSLSQRYGARALAQVVQIDMRNQPSARYGSALAASLQEALAETLNRQEQALVLINRRGFHTLIQCHDCTYVVRCPQCDVSLTFHRDAPQHQQARCHHCGHQQQVPQYCPECAGRHLIQTGIGSQRIEAEIKTILPEARLLRLDRDVAQRKGASREVIHQFSAGEADVLIGTQMVAKGLDISNVTLVGVIQADSSFYMPDYRSSERGFQLLTQVAGRAGRGNKPGKVLLQTMNPDHPVIQLACHQDFEAFYQYEITQRQVLRFPPFSQLFRFIVMGAKEEEVQTFTQTLKNQVSQIFTRWVTEESLQMLGPAPCGVAKLQGQYRYHLLIKNNGGLAVHQGLTQLYRDLRLPPSLTLLLDVDAQSML